MILLALDACLGACQAVVVRDGAVLALASEPMSRGHQERLAPMAREVMDRAGLGFDRLDRIGVSVGPGSFTGLRMGIAFAKGLGFALERPCVGIGTLAALAQDEGDCAAVIDAGRGRVYLQAFVGGRALAEPGILGLEAAAVRLAAIFPDPGFRLAGPGGALLAPAFPAAVLVPRAAPDPVRLAALAASAAPIEAAPLYLREADATPRAGLGAR